MSTWTRILSVLLPVGLILGTIFWLVLLSRQPERFPLREIDIRDELKQVSREEITNSVANHMKEGFFWLDVGAVQKNLKEIPWVSEAFVKRVWPDKIAISIKEKMAVARWGEKGLLSAEGAIFYPELIEVSQKLPQFIGPEERALEMNKQYLNFLERLSAIGLSIKTIELTETGIWKIRLDNAIAIILGKADLEERLSRFVLVYQNNLKAEQEKISYIDLRYTNGMAIGWKPDIQDKTLGDLN
jgi:cell division protein FtsQ